MGDVWFGGMTRNPWNLSEGSSGSSAGSAAATAAGLVPFAIGTETLGSIVSPCTRCRVTGLRPTFGRVSRTGAMTLSWSMDKIGPICRFVEDCGIVFEAIRGADGIDEGAINPPFNYDPTLDLTRLRVGYGSDVSITVRNRLATIASQSPLVGITLPNYPYLGMALIISSVEPAAAFDELTRFGGDAFLTGQGTYDWPNVFRTARTVPAVEYLQADRLRKRLIQDMASLMNTVDLFVVTESDWCVSRPEQSHRAAVRGDSQRRSDKSEFHWQALRRSHTPRLCQSLSGGHRAAYQSATAIHPMNQRDRDLAERGRGELFPGVEHECRLRIHSPSHVYPWAGGHYRLRRHQRHWRRAVLLSSGGDLPVSRQAPF